MKILAALLLALPLSASAQDSCALCQSYKATCMLLEKNIQGQAAEMKRSNIDPDQEGIDQELSDQKDTAATARQLRGKLSPKVFSLSEAYEKKYADLKGSWLFTRTRLAHLQDQYVGEMLQALAQEPGLADLHLEVSATARNPDGTLGTMSTSPFRNYGALLAVKGKLPGAPSHGWPITLGIEFGKDPAAPFSALSVALNQRAGTWDILRDKVSSQPWQDLRINKEFIESEIAATENAEPYLACKLAAMHKFDLAWTQVSMGISETAFDEEGQVQVVDRAALLDRVKAKYGGGVTLEQVEQHGDPENVSAQ